MRIVSYAGVAGRVFNIKKSIPYGFETLLTKNNNIFKTTDGKVFYVKKEVV